jgi:hypothetical protein
MTSREGYLFVWSTSGTAAGNKEWWHANHDERNTGTYGVDARPPGVVRTTQWPAHGAVARFVAPGDDWYSGTVASYRVTYSRSTSPSTTAVSVAPTGAAGATQTLAVPPGTTKITVQAVDHAGNLGRPVTIS